MEKTMENICCKNYAEPESSPMTLAMLESGSRGVIKGFSMNCEDQESCRFVRRLKEMGLHIGAHFEVLNNSGSGEITVTCEGATMALGQGMASKINVEVQNGTAMEGSAFGRLYRKFKIMCRP